MSNILDPDQGMVGPDPSPNCLPRLLADDTGRQRVNLNNYSDLLGVLMNFDKIIFHSLI